MPPQVMAGNSGGAASARPGTGCAATVPDTRGRLPMPIEPMAAGRRTLGARPATAARTTQTSTTGRTCAGRARPAHHRPGPRYGVLTAPTALSCGDTSPVTCRYSAALRGGARRSGRQSGVLRLHRREQRPGPTSRRTPVEGETPGAPGDVEHGRLVQRDVVGIAPHEAHPVAVQHDGDGVAGQQSSAAHAPLMS